MNEKVTNNGDQKNMVMEEAHQKVEYHIAITDICGSMQGQKPDERKNGNGWKVTTLK